jgi:hypothetical protein
MEEIRLKRPSCEPGSELCGERTTRNGGYSGYSGKGRPRHTDTTIHRTVSGCRTRWGRSTPARSSGRAPPSPRSARSATCSEGRSKNAAWAHWKSNKSMPQRRQNVVKGARPYTSGRPIHWNGDAGYRPTASDVRPPQLATLRRCRYYRARAVEPQANISRTCRIGWAGCRQMHPPPPRYA